MRPRIAAWLGYGGLIPFVALGLLICVDHGRGQLWHTYLTAYGAVILSFVGALHWGFAMLLIDITPRRRNAVYAWSVIPCLIAFCSLVAHSFYGDILLAIGFTIQYWQDLRLGAIVLLPAWYLSLRLRLTLVAVICVVAGAIVAAF